MNDTKHMVIGASAASFSYARFARFPLLACLGFSAALVLGCSSSHTQPPPRIQSAPVPAPAPGESRGAESIDQWDKNHPEAARELGAWVRGHAEAAELFFEWDAHNTERAHEFVTWAIRRPGDNIDVFVLEHRGWEYFDKINEQHRPAAEAFIVWARRHGPAAEALMSHPRGLAWAGDHLYTADRKLDRARR